MTALDVPPSQIAQDLWSAVLARLQLDTSPAHFSTYLRDTAGVSYDPEASLLRVAASNPFHVPWLEGRFSSDVHVAVAEIAGAPIRVEFVAQAASRRAGPGRQPPRPAQAPMDLFPETPDVLAREQQPSRTSVTRDNTSSVSERRSSGSPLNPRYTFDAFVVGQSSQLTHAASLAVADEPGRAYNPLFLYGGVGLGKTHLLHAIGHRVLAQGLPVVYVSSETFTNEMVEAIRQHRMDDFRAKYRRTVLLLIDDVQFIAGKERTEEEFFHTFNAIHEAGGQIVLSSDRPPRAMTVLEDRLRSRFEWGLITDLQLPDFETRVAILRSKLGAAPSVAVPSEVLDFMAQRVQSNIRELEGGLNRLLACARHLRQPVTVDLAASALRDLMDTGPSGPTITPEAILEAVSRYFGVPVEQIKGKARNKNIVVPRQLAMYLLREDAHLSTPDIGRLLNRDHTTILHGANLVATDIARHGPSRSCVRGVREVLATSQAA